MIQINNDTLIAAGFKNEGTYYQLKSNDYGIELEVNLDEGFVLLTRIKEIITFNFWDGKEVIDADPYEFFHLPIPESIDDLKTLTFLLTKIKI